MGSKINSKKTKRDIKKSIFSIFLGTYSFFLLGQDGKFSSDTLKQDSNINDVVISGIRTSYKADTPEQIELFSASFFKKNPTPNLLEALQGINGIRAQVNCNVCNTTDIRINGLDGAYTQVLIDGMPIVSALGTVYGLSGIPTSLISRIEVSRGPSSALYGSESIGGLINIITQNYKNAPKISLDFSSTSWGEYALDLGTKNIIGDKIRVLTGLHYFNFQNRIDHNQDNFTDATLQNRISIFQKWNFERPKNRVLGLFARYLYEDRWGGEVNWTKYQRGSDLTYAESIYTNRIELLGSYQLPMKESIFLHGSAIYHFQDSFYGNTPYIGKQNIFFAQLRWEKKWKKHQFLMGTNIRYTFYDDNTPATEIDGKSHSERTYLPGFFIQNEIEISERNRLLFGMRYDYHQVHGNIWTPRLAYQWKWNPDTSLRVSGGTGFRVVNIFSEDHAALTGARKVIIEGSLNPEKSYNVSLNFTHRLFKDSGKIWTFDTSIFYTYFRNRIIPDYETHFDQIIYKNIDEYGESKGIALNLDAKIRGNWTFALGATFMDNVLQKNEERVRPILTERFSLNWAVGYIIRPWQLKIDYTGNLYSPMLLPLAGELDPRPAESPWWSLQNIAFTFTGYKNIEIYGGVKNLLNWTPAKNLPFLIARAHDPFDRNVAYDGQGNALPTPDNPYGLTFDPSYAYAPNQGIRGFMGVRMKF